MVYYEVCKCEDLLVMCDFSFIVVLILGIGMIVWGKNKSEFCVMVEFYNCVIEVMCGVEVILEYIVLL